VFATCDELQHASPSVYTTGTEISNLHIKLFV